MKLRNILLASGFAAAMVGMTSCSQQFDPVNPVIYLEAGAEEGKGTEKDPYGDILDAIAKAKELGQAGAEHITLKFGSGDYSLTETLTLSSEAFGGASLEMICEDEEKAIVGAWLPVTGFTETEVNGVKAWVADMPQLNGETVYSHQFFSSNYERLERPRYPEEGFLVNEFITNEAREKLVCGYYSFTDGEGVVNDAFYFYEGDIPENLTRIEDIQMCMYHFWNDERLAIKSIDYKNNLMEFSGKSWMHLVEIGVGGRYYLDNVFESLNSPGEVYNDRESGKLYYIPYETDDINDFKIFASTIDTIFIIDGMNGSPEKNSLTLKNMGFVGSDWKKVSKRAAQAASDIEASIKLSNSSYIDFIDCSFDHIGNYAVDITTYVNNVTFDHCSLSDLGAGGFRISGKNVVPVTEEVPHDITITDCTINGYGKIYGGAVGVQIQYAHDCTISHNEIANGYYTGLSVGWVWGYDDHATYNILIEKNHIYNIGQGMLSDMGGIYTLGVQPGTVIRGNVVHDIIMWEGGYGGSAFATDEGSSYLLIENNIGYNCTYDIWGHHFGKENIVRNNIFALSPTGGLMVTKKEDHVSVRFERNIVISNFAPIYKTDGENQSWVDDSNLLWDYTLKEGILSLPAPFAEDFKNTKENVLNNIIKNNQAKLRENGFYNNAVIADPLFADPFNGDFTLAENSPAYDIGFEPIDVSDVGPRN